MKEKKFIPLSTASLDKVWRWCEKNETDPLSEAYMRACYACGSYGLNDIAQRLKISFPNNKKRKIWWDIAWDIDRLSYKYRDTIGRAILEMIKREENK